MSDRNNTGAKVSLPEYAARAIIDVTAKTLVTVVPVAVGYVAYFHGAEIAQAIRNRYNKIKPRNRR
jgi:hypothetical protein